MSVIVAQPQPAPRNHAVLRGIIRGTGALVFLCSGMALVSFVVYLITGLVDGSGTYGWLKLLIEFMMAVFFGLFTKVGFEMFREVNAISVSNFAFIFSVLQTAVFYQFMPQSLPKALADAVGNSSFFASVSQPPFNFRSACAFVAFFIFWHVIKICLMRILGLHVPRRW